MIPVLVPVRGCLVLLEDGAHGRVAAIRPRDRPREAQIILRDGRRLWCPIGELRNGYAQSQQVEHVSLVPGRPGLGVGEVQRVRTVADFEQVLVQFFATGESRWLPFQHLRLVMPVELRIRRGETGPFDDHAERFRLRVLARALQIRDANTGAFGRLDIDPLPHQIHVAERVVTSSMPRWLIADDVGLGKTIEVGLVLHALERRNRCRRVLIVCPAGLVQQWKEEMRLKFDRSYEIYWQNFRPETAAEMRLRDRVIVSVDLAKRERHMEMIRAAGDWDVIVFDEAHRLGRSESGERNERYRLAEALRDRAPAFLMLTATPHQGKTGRFAALLELVRPDLAREIAMLELDPSVVGEIVIRNRKTRVTDADGTLLFRGHDTRRVAIAPSAAMATFDAALRGYLSRGYGIAERSGTRGRAVGFVMTTYRKLASSSVSAIEYALAKRLARLNGADGRGSTATVEDLLEAAAEEEDAIADLAALYDPAAFFADEPAIVEHLLAHARAARADDAKLAAFLSEIVAPVLANGESLLVFTEYRVTQRYLADAIAAAYPEAGEVALINGSMTLEDKLASVARFNDRTARVLVSTEAGAEGLNLHEACHILVNYDLPWNPARLVQRIGRLYRYGQTRRVQVINLQADDGFDNQAIALMLDRVETMARDLSAVATENREALEADILGELLANVDMEEILERASTLSIERTEGEIAEAIAAAEKAREVESSILAHADEHRGAAAPQVDARHMLAFVEGMIERLGGAVAGRSRDGRILEIELPEGLVGEVPEFGRRRRVRVTASPRLVRRGREEVFPLDFDGTFVRLLAAAAEERSFDGLFASGNATGGFDVLGIWQVRWQDTEGTPLEEALVPVVAPHEGAPAVMEPAAFSALLLQPLTSAPPLPRSDPDASGRILAAGVEAGMRRDAEPGRMPGAVFLYAALSTSECGP